MSIVAILESDPTSRTDRANRYFVEAQSTVSNLTRQEANIMDRKVWLEPLLVWQPNEGGIRREDFPWYLTQTPEEYHKGATL